LAWKLCGMRRLGLAAVSLVLLTVAAASTAFAEKRVVLLIGQGLQAGRCMAQCTSGPRLDMEDS
jgi:hypothetical protein